MRVAPMRIIGISLALALVTPAASCGRVISDPRPSIILVVIDTLRADYLGCYGFDGDLSPNIDALARESLVYKHCSSQAPWTTPSVASMMTSLLPDLYGVMLPEGAPRDHRQWRREWSPAIPESATTLAEELRARGYRTAAFIANPFLIDGLGFDQGFEVFDSRRARAPDRSAERLFDDCAGWLDDASSGRAPFFLYLHLMDVHGPYDAPVRDFYAVRNSPGLGPDHRLTNDEYDRIQPYLRKPRWAREPDGRHVRTWRGRYAAGVHAADRQLGRFLERVRAHRWWHETVVVVTSDHGEELFDHGGWDHGFSLHQHQLEVPLLIRLPESSSGGTALTRRVSLVDLMPTLLVLAGVSPPPGLAGRDIMSQPPDPPVPSFASCNKDSPEEVSVTVGQWKLIAELETGNRRLFDLEADPLELHDLSAEPPPEAEAIEEVLQQLLARRAAAAAESQPVVELSDEELERLRELGYVE